MNGGSLAVTERLRCNESLQPDCSTLDAIILTKRWYMIRSFPLNLLIPVDTFCVFPFGDLVSLV